MYKLPADGCVNKFVITEGESYFAPCLERMGTPTLADILGEIFDLDDPEVFQEVEEKLSEGKIILGYYDPSTKEVDVHLPLEVSEYVKNRIKEVFDV